MPQPQKGEKLGHFLSKFMGSSESRESFPDQKQRAAVAYNIFKNRKKKRASANEKSE